VDSQLSISLRSFDRSIEQAYFNLFGMGSGERELLDWRFRANPHGEAKFAVATRGERVVGMIALIPTHLAGIESGALGYQAIDTIVDPSCRGQGLFVKLGSFVQDQALAGAALVWGFPNANAARGWYGRLGWSNFGAAPLLMRPLRSAFLLGKLHPKLRSIDVRLVRGRNVQREVYTDGQQLSADFDHLWRRVAGDFGIGVDRSGEWMRWRLFDKPGADYRCVGLKSDVGELEAFVAVRIADKHGGRLCYVMEAMCSPRHRRDLARLLLAELSRAARHGAEVALAWCPKSAPNYAAFRKAGFVPVPPRLRPIEINFGARALHQRYAAAAANGASWYVSFLDSDTN